MVSYLLGSQEICQRVLLSCGERENAQMQEAEGVTEELKARDQLAWVGGMNSIRSRAEEIILSEMIFVAGASGEQKEVSGERRETKAHPPSLQSGRHD